MKLRLFILIILVVPSVLAELKESLRCYSCNSNHQKCGDERSNFDANLHQATYCSGYCVKIVTKPGDFLMRTCTTFLNNLTISNPNAQECYLSTYSDPNVPALLNNPAYYCFCNDKIGCNQAFKTKTSILVIFLLIFRILIK
jgi:hypothetical protein